MTAFAGFVIGAVLAGLGTTTVFLVQIEELKSCNSKLRRDTVEDVYRLRTENLVLQKKLYNAHMTINAMQKDREKQENWK